MVNIENSTDTELLGVMSSASSEPRNVRGGWLADEMGMGKTAVCAALMCHSKGTATGGLTVVLCNNTLVGQWVDEIKKFAPSLTRFPPA